MNSARYVSRYSSQDIRVYFYFICFTITTLYTQRISEKNPRIHRCISTEMYKVKYIICSEAYWLGALRWNERMRGEEPAVWLHWVGKDPVEICNKLPHPDENGICFFKTFNTLKKFTCTLYKNSVSQNCLPP